MTRHGRPSGPPVGAVSKRGRISSRGAAVAQPSRLSATESEWVDDGASVESPSAAPADRAVAASASPAAAAPAIHCRRVIPLDSFDSIMVFCPPLYALLTLRDR